MSQITEQDDTETVWGDLNAILDCVPQSNTDSFLPLSSPTLRKKRTLESFFMILMLWVSVVASLGWFKRSGRMVLGLIATTILVSARRPARDGMGGSLLMDLFLHFMIFSIKCTALVQRWRGSNASVVLYEWYREEEEGHRVEFRKLPLYPFPEVSAILEEAFPVFSIRSELRTMGAQLSTSEKKTLWLRLIHHSIARAVVAPYVVSIGYVWHSMNSRLIPRLRNDDAVVRADVLLNPPPIRLNRAPLAVRDILSKVEECLQCHKVELQTRVSPDVLIRIIEDVRQSLRETALRCYLRQFVCDESMFAPITASEEFWSLVQALAEESHQREREMHLLFHSVESAVESFDASSQSSRMLHVATSLYLSVFPLTQGGEAVIAHHMTPYLGSAENRAAVNDYWDYVARTLRPLSGPNSIKSYLMGGLRRVVSLMIS